MKTETKLKYLSKAIFIACFASSTVYAADVKQSALATKTAPVTGDKALIIDSADGNKSKNVTLGSLPVATAAQTALDLKETKAVVQASAPADTTVDWYDTDQESGVLVLKRHNGTTWVRASSHGVQYASSCASITAGMCVDTDDGKLYYHNNTSVVEVGVSVDLSNYLSKTNTTAFTPSADYHPATKKYVDDAVTSGGGYTDEQAQDAVGGMFSGNNETGITVTYNDTTGKVDFVVATQSDVNFTSELNTKLAGIAAGAEVNVNADWNASSGDAQILNKPTIPTISDTAYGSSWNGDLGAASKNAIYDKIETIVGGSLPSWLPSTGPTADNQIIQATGSGTAEWTSTIDGMINDAGTGTDDLLSAYEIGARIAAKLAAPGPIGATTPSTGAFTTVTASSFDTSAPATGETGEIGLQEDPTNGTNTVTIKAPSAMASDVVYVLPAADGTAGLVLSTDGSGHLSWVTK